jgi:ribosome-associated protein
MFEIPEEKLVFKTSRSSGPGGQNVNKLNTKVTLCFDAANYEGFTETQRQRILKQLATRADKNGRIRVTCQRERTQRANRDAAVERLKELLTEALKRRPVRKKSKVPRWAMQKRLEDKRKRALLKKQRAEKIRP